MSFNALQEATEILGETELYEFDFGEFLVHYTSSRKTINYNGFFWRPLPVKRTGLDQSQELETAVTQLTTKVKPEFADAVVKGSLTTIGVKIIRGFGTNYIADYQNPFFVGQVSELNVSESQMTLTIESKSERALETQIPRVIVQSNCNNLLYDPLTCTVEKALNTLTSVVNAVSVDGTTITVPTLNKADVNLTLAPVNHFQKGQLSKQGSVVIREILEQPDGVTLKIHVPIPGLSVGDALTLLVGCDHKETTCDNKFDNQPNFVGFTEVSAQNPVTDGF